MGPVRQNPIQRTVSLFICVCIALCTIVAHNIAQNRPDSFPPYPPDDHHSSDDVYLREGGEAPCGKVSRKSAQGCRKICGVKKIKQECGPMPNVMAAEPNIGGVLCEISVIPFLVPRCKVWLTPNAGVSCSNPANMMGERKRRKVNCARGKIPSGGKNPQKCIYSVPAQETAKDHAKFGWPPVSDVAAVMKPRRESR